MKVEYKQVKGTLVTMGDIIQFVPDKNPYSPDRITFVNAQIVSIGGKEDDYCICVTGYVDKGNNLFEKLTYEPFYPRIKDML
jgi:hypothetical protein